MDNTEADIGFGTSLWMGNGAEPPVFTEVAAEITDIAPPGISADVVEATHHKSPGRFKERIAALRDSKAVNITFNYVRGSTAIASLRAKVGAKARTQWQVRIPPTEEGGADGETHQFLAYATDFTPTTPLAEVMSGALTLTPSGPVAVSVTPAEV